MEPLKFEDWYALNEEELNIKYAEQGWDRAPDFKSEDQDEAEYELYLKSF